MAPLVETTLCSLKRITRLSQDPHAPGDELLREQELSSLRERLQRSPATLHAALLASYSLHRPFELLSAEDVMPFARG